MASTSKCVSFLFLITLFSSLQIHARESNFFSKVSTDNNVNLKDTQLNEEPTVTKPSQDPNQEPHFIPQTQKSYGLYGHDDLPSTATKPEEDPFKFPNTNADAYYNTQGQNNNDKYYNKNTYETEQENMYQNNNNNYYKNAYDTRLSNQNNYNDEDNNDDGKYYNKNSYEEQQVHGRGSGYKNTENRKSYYNGGNGYSNPEKKGMSDTRFLENGKYYYDVNSEKKNNLNGYQDSRGEASNNGYNTRGYYGGNNFEGYQNQNQNQEEFQESQNEFNP